MPATDLPVSGPIIGAWRHVVARDGFETAFLRAAASGFVLEGHTTAVEDGIAWAVQYMIEVDERWVTHRCHVRSWSTDGAREVLLTRDPVGRWRVDGVLVPELDGCLDVDLEASASTNLLPVRRAGSAIGVKVSTPAAYVRAPGLEIERLEQTYRRIGDGEDGRRRFEYRAPRFGFECDLEYAADGLVLDYPGIAARVV